MNFWPQKGQNKIFPGTYIGLFHNKPKIQIKYAKLRRSHHQILRNWPKRWFLAKNGHILATNDQILDTSEFSRLKHHDFLKEDHKGSFITNEYTKKWSPATANICLNSLFKFIFSLIDNE